ncbi:MAG: nucleotidyl transferase AbiEii/AbiGii toxin family protein [Planctomycetota bacterium]|jgi:hypothetical protein
MPLTDFQKALARLLSVNRAPDSYLAGGAALHIEPNSRRYSKDLDFFQDSEERVDQAFKEDHELLSASGYGVEVDLRIPGTVRAMVHKGSESTRVEWAHDSAWRFLPVLQDPDCGYRLHPIDVAVNKVLALVGRDEPRDLLDTIDVHGRVLPLGALCWAAAGKDPGYTPDKLLDLLQRRGKARPEDLARLHLAVPVDLQTLKTSWRSALDQAQAFLRTRPLEEIGCLYWSKSRSTFVQPGPEDARDAVPHFGRPGGVLPAVVEGP